MENEKEPVSEETTEKYNLKGNKTYRTAHKVYDISLIFFLLILMLFSAKTFFKLEIIIGGVFCTSYFNFAYLVPCAMMLIGLGISLAVAKKHNVQEKKDKIWFIALSILTAVILILSVMDLVTPSYHVYSKEEVKADDGAVFLVAKSETVTIGSEFHSTMPSYYDVDVYSVNGIFAKRLIKIPTHNGTYEIKKRSDGEYKIILSYLGIKEGFPFSTK